MKKNDNSPPTRNVHTIQSIKWSHENEQSRITGEESLLLKAFRDLEPKFKTMVLAVVTDQAAACLSRKRPMLKLVSSQGESRS
ncbi:hypothetical protein EJD96_16100 [Herbaspirillum seropedicae]|uniref:hypothetical protein n=1 Tax=Herbaspirillum seropedicae TaxID=964 RepID=UPI00111FBF91|nr:hypothetical protein [Herbaspirillum seropedicae]QDD65571.1 hypothetical protein EJD96_16100 [Herbaspirillum seropedicae]